MVQQLKAIIVDDEERARKTLGILLESFCPEVEIIAKCKNVPEAVTQIKLLQPDLVFLDIEMPEYNGFELFDLLTDIQFHVIFVTAYDQYAIKAFEVSAVDYLLKPVEIEMLQKAVQKVYQQQQLTENKMQLDVLKNTYYGAEIKKIALPFIDGIRFVDTDEISLFAADGAYTNVMFKNGSKIMVSKRLKIFEDLLEGRPTFFRAHRSSLINVNCIRQYSKGKNSLLMDNGSEISLSRDRKQAFEALLLNMSISL